MRVRLSIPGIVTAMVATLLFAVRPADAQVRGDEGPGGGLSAGDYLRVAAGVTTPINPQGSLADWKQGVSAAVEWENWSQGGAGVSRVGFGLAAAYARLPLDREHFIANFTPIAGGKATNASSSGAGILEITSKVRLRIPAPLIMPALTFGFGFINWAPGTVKYTSTATTGESTVKQTHRSGAELSFGGSVDRQVYDRWAVYAEAAYVFGYTSYGRYATPTGVCAAGCDPLKNTTVGALRAGVRMRAGDR